jgi:hypothetical protein
LAAWIYEDKSFTEDGKIQINDGFLKFEWVQDKSNENVREESLSGSGEGKGFSFYFSRLAYRDKYFLRNASYSTGGYDGGLAKIRTELINEILDSSNIPKRLTPKKAVFLIIDDSINDSTHIISSCFSFNNKYIYEYAKNQANMMMAQENVNIKLKEKKLDLIDRNVRKRLIEKIKVSLIEGTKEFEQLINSI